MNRRQFLQTLGAAGLAESLLPALPARPQWPPADRTFTGDGGVLLQPALDREYFSEEVMLRRLGVPRLLAPDEVEVVAYNFPSWHPSPYMEERFGKGWTEFETLKASRPLFPGHLFPKYPLWGYFDESDPQWAAREIDAAADHGLNAWMIDWYWHEGTQFYQEQLERGFLRAPNRHRLKFAIMWANHDWKNVYPAASPGAAAVLLPQTHSRDDFRRVTSYCIEHYFRQENYWRINGALVFGLFDLAKVISFLGENGTREALQEMREAVRRAGLGELHLQSNNGHDAVANRLRELGIDSATVYNPIGWTYHGGAGTAGPYGRGAVEAVDSWERQKQRCNVPTFPNCPVGWDDSPRFGTGAHVAVGRTPDQFERLVRAARHFVAADSPRIVYVSAWNEWTEDHVLLPDSIWGYGYLEALRRGARGPAV